MLPAERLSHRKQSSVMKALFGPQKGLEGPKGGAGLGVSGAPSCCTGAPEQFVAALRGPAALAPQPRHPLPGVL